ncbi:MAG TPA: hypothetical protein VFJ58_22215 [Armatimonadota bacterium]|nr:hypothetical protein [Armatimonadota bacterium]
MLCDGGLAGLWWCALCGSAPLLIAVWNGESELGLAAFIGAASIGAVGGILTAVFMSLFFSSILLYDHKDRARRRQERSSCWISDRPTRVKLDPVASPNVNVLSE